MFEQLEKLEARYRQLEELLASYGIISDKEQYNRYARELSDLKGPVSLFREHRRVLKEIGDLETVLAEKHEKELAELARHELQELQQKKEALEGELRDALKGEDEDIGRDVIVEIRPGT